MGVYAGCQKSSVDSKVAIDRFETGAEIDIKEDGFDYSWPDGASIEKAMNWIKSLVEEPEVGRFTVRCWH